MPEPDRFFFLRFQKTGGTALTIRLRELFGPDAIYPRSADHGDVNASFSIPHLLAEFEAHRDELRVFSGHFPLSAMELLGVPMRTFTVLRDPVERTLSLLRSRAQRGGERFAGRPLEEIYDHPEVRDIATNHMVKMLALARDELGDAPLLQPMELDRGRLEIAKERLTGIDVVGLQEDVDGFTRALEARFGWDLGENRFANRTERQPEDPALRHRIADDNALDVELYEFARELAPPRSGARSPAPAPNGKIVITGTGRSGTTLLVQVLDDLGLDTGLSEGRLSEYVPSVRAGLESRVDDPDAPTVVKDMTLGFRLDELLREGTVEIRHVILPDRRLDVAAASRVRAAEYGRRPFGRGALTGTVRATEQLRVLAQIRSELIGTCERHSIPVTLLEFPRFATDAAYTWKALAPILEGVTLDDVQRALDRRVRPDMIHEAPLSRAERWRTRLITAFMVLYRYPMGRIRARLDPQGQEAKIRSSVAAARQREAALAEAERRAGRLPGS